MQWIKLDKRVQIIKSVETQLNRAHVRFYNDEGKVVVLREESVWIVEDVFEDVRISAAESSDAANSALDAQKTEETVYKKLKNNIGKEDGVIKQLRADIKHAQLDKVAVDKAIELIRKHYDVTKLDYNRNVFNKIFK